MPPQYVRRTLKRAADEIDAGRPWRAKEILQGSLAANYNALEPDFLEAYGVLLDMLGDRFEAGKFLFLSGRRKDVCAEPIGLFLSRTRKVHVNDLIAQFPAAIRASGLGHLPAVVQDDLRRRGATARDLEKRDPIKVAASPMTWKDRFVVSLIVGGILLFFSSALVGFATIVGWLM